MKLQELAAPQRTKQVAKVMESYFGGRVGFDQLIAWGIGTIGFLVASIGWLLTHYVFK